MEQTLDRTRPVRLLLVDDHQVVLEGLVSMLASERDRVSIVGATTEPGEALRLAADLEPDVVLLDVRLKGASGLDLCQEVTKAAAPSCGVIRSAAARSKT